MAGSVGKEKEKSAAAEAGVPPRMGQLEGEGVDESARVGWNIGGGEVAREGEGERAQHVPVHTTEESFVSNTNTHTSESTTPAPPPTAVT